MKIILSGGSGVIGSAIIKNYPNDEIYVLSRSGNPEKTSKNVNSVYWDGETIGDWAGILNDADVVINLAGENIGNKRWTAAQKQRIIDSRVKAGNTLSRAVLSCERKPKLFIQASAIGIYGTDLTSTFDENSPLGNDYLSGVGKVWEESISALKSTTVQTVILRFGVVLTETGGVLPKLVFPIRSFVGGPIGSGNQWISWVHLDDVVRIVDFVIHTGSAFGVYNVTSPNPVTNKEIGQKIASVLKRPFYFPVPGFILKLLLGEMSVLVLDGQKVLPKRLIEEGFEFKFSEISDALKNLLT